MAGSADTLSYNDVDFREFLIMLWRRKSMLIFVVLCGLVITFFAAQILEKRYSARSLLLLESAAPDGAIHDVQSALLGSVSFDNALVLSEIEIIRSRTMARKVIERLGLMGDVDFNSAPRSPALSLQSLYVADMPQSDFKSLRLYDKTRDHLPPEVMDKNIAKAVHQFLDRLNVRAISGSYAIQITYQSSDPAKAALIANTIADMYIEQRLESRFRATKKLTDWLNRRLGELQDQVFAAESAVERYKAQHNLTTGTRHTISVEQISALNAELVNAKAAQAEARARLDQVENFAQSDVGLAGLADLVDSDFLRQLKLEQARIEAVSSRLSSRYGPRHPEMIKVRLELDEIQKNIHQEIIKIRETLRGEVSFARARIEALQAGLNDVTGQNNLDNEAMIALRELERQAHSTNLIYNKFLETYKRSDDQEELQEPEAQIISYAVIPHFPSFPNYLLIYILGVFLSFFLALIIVIFWEKLDDSFKSVKDIEKAFGFPCFAMIPDVPRSTPWSVASYTLKEPHSPTAEAIRALRMGINLRARDLEKKPQVIGLTSALPSEGRTTVAVWLARQAAKSGERVLIIDADMRYPNLHKAVEAQPENTLVDYLLKACELDEVIQKDPQSGAHMIFSRSAIDQALDLMNGQRMHQLISSLRQVYDLIIIDTPGASAVSDATLIATVSDKMLFAVQWDKTSREAVAGGVKRFLDVDFDDLAFIFTRVDVKRHARYGYGDPSYIHL